jgi:hypothetical protein
VSVETGDIIVNTYSGGNKMRKIQIAKGATILSVMVMFCSCGGPKQMKFGTPEGAPNWVDKIPEGTTAVGISDPGLLHSTSRTMAVNRGRQELSSQLSSQVSGAIQEAVNKLTQTGGGYSESSEEKPWQQGSTIMNKVGKGILLGAKAREYWTNPEDGTTYSLVVIDKEIVKNSVAASMNDDRLEREYGKELLDTIISDTNQTLEKFFED